MREKQPFLQLDCNKQNHTQICTEKNEPNNRLITKRKIRQFAQQILKEGPVESQLTLS